jgi:hypothetical protein
MNAGWYTPGSEPNQTWSSVREVCSRMALRSAIIHDFALKSSFFKPLGASRLNRAVIAVAVFALAALTLVACGGYSSSYKGTPSRLSTRVMVSQGVTAGLSLGGLFVVNARIDQLARVREIGAGSNPGLMTLSPTRATLLAFDAASGSVEIIDTTKEANTGSIKLPGPDTQTPAVTSSMVIPATTGIGYAADPVAVSNLWTSPGAIVVMNLTSGSITTQIGVPGAQTVVSNPNGAQLLVFSSDSNSVSVISPLLAVPPIDQGCDTAPNPVCTVVPGFDRPVSAIFNGSTVYILNCGAECGGTQASVQTLDLSTTPPTPGAPLPVDGATVAFLDGNTLYVAGTPQTNNACTGQTTAATTCGRLDVIDLGSTKVTNRVVIPDGYHDRIDMGLKGQLFVGSHTCSEIGNVNNPSGEVRGCLAIFDTTKAGNSTAIIPPDNGDVTGLQSFGDFFKEYVAEGGNLRVYNTTTDKLEATNDFITGGTVNIVGQVIDVKAVDFF